jgi:hypothetical protein
MMDIGNGVAIAGLCVSGGAVAITAIRTFVGRGKENYKNGGNGGGGAFPCKEHSGLVVCLEGIEKNQERQERWLGEISQDVKNLLKRK